MRKSIVNLMIVGILIISGCGVDSTPTQPAIPTTPLKPTPIIKVPSDAEEITPYTEVIHEILLGDLIIINNPNAENVTLKKVRNFLRRDNTDEAIYEYDSDFGSFAVAIHNAAEANAIKTGIAIVEFEGGKSIVLNVFHTQDYGIIYVDCTGKGRWDLSEEAFNLETNNWDKVAYVQKGEKLGFLTISKTENFSYRWYQNVRDKYETASYEYDQYLLEKKASDNSYQSFKAKVSWDSNYIKEGGLSAGTLPAETRAWWERYYPHRIEWWNEKTLLLLEINRIASIWSQLQLDINDIYDKGCIWEQSQYPVKNVTIFFE